MDRPAIHRTDLPQQMPRDFNIAAYVLAAADISPKKSALECLSAPGQIAHHWTYAALRADVLATASGLLASGLTQGDKLVLRLGNHPRFPILFLAATAIGVLPVITPAAWTKREFATALQCLGPVQAIACDDAAPLSVDTTPILTADKIDALKQHAPATPIITDANAPAYIVFTSGSTGAPKAVVHGHRAVWARRMMWRDWYDLQSADRLLHAGAFNWTYTLGTGLLDPWSIGATALVYTGPSDRTIWPKLLRAHDATLFAAAPGVFRQLTKTDLAPIPTLRHALSAGEGLPKPVAQAWAQATGTHIYGALGMSECSTYISASPSQADPRPQTGRHVAILGKDGRPAPIDTPGDLAIHRTDPGLMLGYLKSDTQSSATQTDLPLTGDWFLTGDRAMMGASGIITHAGRDDALITAGGYRIAPQDIEALLGTFPEITDCAAVGLTTQSNATIVAAFYVSPAPIDHNDLATYMTANLARYKVPRAFIHLAALPTRANGKLDRKALATWTLPT